MAKRGEDGTEQATGDEVVKVINKTQLTKLLKGLSHHQDAIDEIKGKMGGSVNAAVETYHVDKKMLGWIRQLYAMKTEKLAYHLDNFYHMLDVSGLSAKAESVQRLPIEGGGEGEETETEDEPGAKPDNVKKFPAPNGHASA